MRFKLSVILSIIFIQLTTIQLFDQKSTNKTPIREVLDSTLFRVIYKVNQQIQKDGVPAIITDTMALDIGENWSSYYFIGQIKVPSNRFLPRVTRYSSDREALEKRLTAKQEILEVRDLRLNTGESAKIFKNKNKKEIITIDQGPMTSVDKFALFRLTEVIPPQQWSINEDTLTVLNFVCRKATTFFRGRQYSAWFTLELPVNDGPWKFYGLPGMILKIEDAGRVFVFNAIGLQKMVNSEIAIDWDYRFVSGYLDCSIKQWQTFRQERFRYISIGFNDGDAVVYYRTKNPITYPEMEIDE
ncbi:MAG: GLPGLI family protein [Tissierellia bacterium]|nr:GLPGLI family protein [Tissierellia bacterium]